LSGQALPEYQRAADAIKSRITSADIGSVITIPGIQQATGTTYSTARRTADHLESEGVLRARQGKGYEVIATPQKAAEERASTQELARRVAELRELVRDLSVRLESAESSLEDLYDKLGYDYADGSGERAEEPAPAARRGRTG
jgi:DNA-binding GntR family transcriptional regulator